MTRLFIQNVLSENYLFVLDEENSHYLRNVLRMRLGEEIVIVDKDGSECLSAINAVDTDAVTVKVLERRPCVSESPCRITLYQSVSKGERMDLTIQKSVELGVSRIVPVSSERCVARPPYDAKKIARWQKIALEAARQSGRGLIPLIGEPADLASALKAAGEDDLVLFPWEEEKGKTLREVLEGKKPSSISVFIGPEGGYSQEEADLARDLGAVPVTLGNRILRTETAGPAVLAMLLYHNEL